MSIEQNLDNSSAKNINNNESLKKVVAMHNTDDKEKVGAKESLNEDIDFNKIKEFVYLMKDEEWEKKMGGYGSISSNDIEQFAKDKDLKLTDKEINYLASNLDTVSTMYY